MITYPKLEENQYKTWYVRGIRARLRGIHYNEANRQHIPSEYIGAWIDGWESLDNKV